MVGLRELAGRRMVALCRRAPGRDPLRGGELGPEAEVARAVFGWERGSSGRELASVAHRADEVVSARGREERRVALAGVREDVGECRCAVAEVSPALEEGGGREEDVEVVEGTRAEVADLVLGG